MADSQHTVYCKKSDILKYELEERALKADPDQFPHALKTPHKLFELFEDYMNTKVHPVIAAGAATHDDGLLTGHGADHVQTVINVAGKLVTDNLRVLNGYEIYILLLAIHLHDVGNYFGRTSHEENIREVIKNVPFEILLDEPIKMLLLSIASTHGGKQADGNKDKISELRHKEPCNSIEVRPQLLASILRFADELSDDNTRVNNLPVPTKNEMFHKYCAALSPVSLSGNTVTMQYYVSVEDVMNKYKIGRKKGYLFQEIRNRLEKCMRELEYCRMFAEGIIRITTLSVQISVVQTSKFEPLAFRLTLSGYPNGKTFEDYLVVDNKDSRNLPPKNGEEFMKYYNARGTVK